MCLVKKAQFIMFLWGVVVFIMTMSGTVSAKSKWDLRSDTWVATDALGRELPGYEEVGAPREGKYVGLFYFTYQGQWGTTMGGNVTEILAKNPKSPEWGPHLSAHFWAEPELGYYFMNDEYVLRKHAEMLVVAGIDVVIFDTSNLKLHTENYMTLCRVWQEMRDEGYQTPQIAFFLRGSMIPGLYYEFYRKELYKDLWFLWKGKPLILVCDGNQRLNQVYMEFFTVRFITDSSGHFRRWTWIDWMPLHPGYDEDRSVAEQVSVSIARHPTTNVGRSYHNGSQPELNEYHLTGREGEGLHFAEQWSRALEIDPEFIFITGWNEWAASRNVYVPGVGVDNWFVGRKLEEGDTYFIDAYNMEFSRDAEPMKGGFTDNYYYQMIANIRRFKGVRAPEAPTPPMSIDIDGCFEQWSNVAPEYRDHIGDTAHRHSVGYNDIVYTNTTGRNDIVRAKVTHDEEYVCFYVETNEALTPSTDPYWMLLFIDIDRSKNTGWEGYDYVVNLEVVDEKSTTLMKTTSGWKWSPVSTIPYRVQDNKLHLRIPRLHLGLADVEDIVFDFKWADNIQREDDITEFFVNGDVAPSRRFNYRYDSRLRGK